jgi:hypothetical protein
MRSDPRPTARRRLTPWFTSTSQIASGPFGHVPPSRNYVDDKVIGFQALDTQNILVLGDDNNLWLEHPPFGLPGRVPPHREHVDSSVAGFQGLDAQTVIVLGTDGNYGLRWRRSGLCHPNELKLIASAQVSRRSATLPLRRHAHF